MKKGIEKLVDCMPWWFERLVSGKSVFGAQKDKLVLEILSLGGLYDLKKLGGMKLSRKAEPLLNMSIDELKCLRRRLKKNSELGRSKLLNTLVETVGNADLHHLGGGAFSAFFSSRRKRGTIR